MYLLVYFIYLHGFVNCTYFQQNLNNASEEKRTVFNAFTNIRHRVNTSNVMVYGDFRIGHQKLSSFIGRRKTSGKQTAKFKLNTIKQKVKHFTKKNFKKIPSFSSS